MWGPILEWARSTVRLDGSLLEKNLVITEAARVPAYELTLQTLFETRDIDPDPLKVPLTEGAEPADKPKSREQVDLWEAPSVPPAEFKEHRASRPIPSTLKIYDCTQCIREGKVDCDRCGGAGRSACANCRGRGRKACDTCHGLAKTNCLRCNGRGMKEGVTLLTKAEDACPACQGAGKIPCARCQHGELECEMCGAQGKIECAKCKTLGKVVCADCQGEGQLLKGLSVSSFFKPYAATAFAAVEPIPAPVVKEALEKSKRSAPERADVLLDETFVQKAEAPDTIKFHLKELLAKLKPMLSHKTRAVRQEMSLTRTEAIRVRGSFEGQDLVCWMVPGENTVFPDKNPFQDLVDQLWGQAQAAIGTGDFSNAQSLARRTLAYDPLHAEATRFLNDMETRVKGETLKAGLLGGLAAFGLAAGFIFFEKGVHKLMPALQAGLALVLLSAGIGAAWLPVVKKVPGRRLRFGAVFGSSFGVLALMCLLVRGVLGWDIVRAADQRAFQQDWDEYFPRGVSELYWPDDLRNLQALLAEYQGSRVDLSEVKKSIERQKRYRTEKEQVEQRFRERLAQTLQNGGLSIPQKIAQLEEIRQYYKLQSVDVSAVDGPLQEMTSKLQAAPSAPRGKISITRSAAPAAAPKKAPPPRARPAPSNKTRYVAPSQTPILKKSRRVPPVPEKKATRDREKAPAPPPPPAKAAPAKPAPVKPAPAKPTPTRKSNSWF